MKDVIYVKKVEKLSWYTLKEEKIKIEEEVGFLLIIYQY